MKQLLWIIILVLAIVGLLPIAGAAQTVPDTGVIIDKPTITIAAATADSSASKSASAHSAIVQFTFGTVTGTYTGCTVQAKTTVDGTNYLNLSTAASITVTTGTTTTWTVTAKGPASGNTSTPSTTTADGFGQLTKFTFACASAYGTSAPVTVSVIYSPAVTDVASVLASLAVSNDCDGTIRTRKYYISVGTSEDESQVKATPGTLCAISARNAHASTNAFLKCTNLTAANTTPGSSAVFYEMMIPFGLGYVDNHIDLPFDTALTCYIVTGKAASDATEVGADDVSYVLRYR